MIISLRGTSGSGKTTLVKAIMQRFQDREPVHIAGRKQPLYYKLWRQRRGGPPDLTVLGHYEVACGGCDTLPSLDTVFDLAASAALTGSRHVLFEGLLLGIDVKRTAALLDYVSPDELLVMFLNTPVDLCIQSVNTRRWTKDPTKDPVDPANTESKHRALQSIPARLHAQGVRTETLTRGEALTRLCVLLGA